MLNDLTVHAILSAIGGSFSDSILDDDDQCVLAPLIEVHYGLNVLFLVLGLHEDCYYQFEEAKDVSTGFMFRYFYEVDVFGQKGLSALLYVGLHALQDYLQVSQLLNPLL